MKLDFTVELISSPLLQAYPHLLRSGLFLFRLEIPTTCDGSKN